MRGRRKGGATATPAPPPPAASLSAHAKAFLEHLGARSLSAATVGFYDWSLRGFLEWADSRQLANPAVFTRATIEAYQLHLHQYRCPRTGEPLVVNTQLGRLGVVRRFFAWLCRSGTLSANPAADLDLPRKQSRRLPKALSPEELDRLFSLPNPADPMGLRDRTILELFYATGIRRTEMTRLDPGDYDPDTQTLLIRHGKNDKSRLLPVGGRAAFWLDRFLAESRPLFDHLPNETALFLSGYGTRITPAYLGTWVAGQMKKAGITKPGACHLLRHSMATDMHLNGADIRFVQEMLGHARLETTQIYTHVNIKALAEVHARTHPHGTLPKDHEHGYREPEPPESLASEPPASEPPPDIPPDPGPPPQPDGPSPTTPPAPADSPEDSPCGTGGAVLGVPPAMQAIHSKSCPTHPAVPKPPGPDENPPEPGPELPSDRPTPPNPPNPLNPFTSNTLQQTDPAAGGGHVAFYAYRWYDPLTGRWPSRDPIGEGGGVNLYGFVKNDAIDQLDAFGLRFVMIGPHSVWVPDDHPLPPQIPGLVDPGNPPDPEERRWNEWRLARLALVSDEPSPSKERTCCVAGEKVDYDSAKQCCSKSLTPESRNFGSELVDRFKICITANGDPGTSPSETGHAWITITNLATGRTDTWANWKSGTRSVGYVGESGVQSGNELKPKSYESNFEKNHSKFSRRCKYICGFELSRAIGGGFGDLTNNCSTYAAEQWKFSTGESLSAGTIVDSPGDLKVSIANANR